MSAGRIEDPVLAVDVYDGSGEKLRLERTMNNEMKITIGGSSFKATGDQSLLLSWVLKNGWQS